MTFETGAFLASATVPRSYALLKLDEKAPICKNSSENFLHRGGSTMTTQAVARIRRPRGTYPKRSDSPARTKKLPEYLEAHEVEAIIRATDNPRAKLLMLEQWRAGLRIAEALALEVADLSLDAEPPTLRVRSGKGNRSRIVPMHRELQAALRFGTLLWEHQRGEARRRSPVDGLALGQGGGTEG